MREQIIPSTPPACQTEAIIIISLPAPCTPTDYYHLHNSSCFIVPGGSVTGVPREFRGRVLFLSLDHGLAHRRPTGERPAAGEGSHPPRIAAPGPCNEAQRRESHGPSLSPEGPETAFCLQRITVIKYRQPVSAILGVDGGLMVLVHPGRATPLPKRRLRSR